MASIYQRANGTYCVRVYAGIKFGVQKIVSKTYFPPPGMPKSRIEKDLQKFAREFEYMVHAGKFIPGMKISRKDTRSCYMTVGQFAELYFLPSIEDRLSPNTVRFYRAITEQFIVPSFGDMRLIQITGADLQAFVNYLAFNPGARADGKELRLSPQTVMRYASVFRALITQAMRERFLVENPFDGYLIEYPKDKQKTVRNLRNEKCYGMGEIRAFLSALRQEKPLHRILLLTSVVLGARRAEVVALRWNDVDFDENCIYIDKSAYKLKGQQQALKSPKSEQGYRCIFFPEIYRDELLSWKHEQQKIRETAGKGWREQGFIFTRDNGDMFSLYGLTDLCAWFEKKNSFRHLKLHGLRHTFDSLLCSKGIGMETIKELMGHKSVSTTEIYTHAMTEDKQKAAEAMNDILSAFREEEKDAEHAVESNA